MAAYLIKIGKRPFLYRELCGSILVSIARLLHSVRTILRNLFIFRADRRSRKRRDIRCRKHRFVLVC